jgi:hypothetical protein
MRLWRRAGFDVRGADDAALLAVWRACARRPANAPADPILAIAWRDAAGVFHAYIAREYLHSSHHSNWRIASALHGCCMWCFAIAFETPTIDRVQVAVTNAYGVLQPVEQCPRLQVLPDPFLPNRAPTP